MNKSIRPKTKKKDLGDYSDIKHRFREIRIDNRLTQADLAKIVGLTSGSVGAIEQGLYTPNFKVLRALNKRLGVSYSYIIDGVKDDSDSLRTKVKQLQEENDMLKKVVQKLTK
jgi:transcriptional regulator with XRE-family HTH domain